MIDRKIERLKPTEPDIHGFHFVWPGDHEVGVREVLNAMDGVQLYEERLIIEILKRSKLFEAGFRKFPKLKGGQSDSV